jgi:ATP-dependent Lhr-like helicase
VNIGTIVSESFVDVFLRRRRLGSVEENFIKQLQIGDLFVLGGRILRLVETGLQAAYVERADGHLPTVPRWNAAKMPLTSGLAEGVRNIRANSRAPQAGGSDVSDVDWLVENYEISISNAEAISSNSRAAQHFGAARSARRC